MEYTEYTFLIFPKEEYQDILIAFLEHLPFETFIESEEGFIAYSKELMPEQEIEEILNNPIFQGVDIHYTTQQIEDKNWNEEWEKDFEPIYIDDQIYVKADFHPEIATFPYVIRIQPKMAFGTGHHATTHLMLQNMLKLDFDEKSVLDMGSGTAILAIFAKLKGANYVEAVDVDSWAYENAIENVMRNHQDINVKQGDVNVLGDKIFDIILANINKNILMDDIPAYVKVLSNNGFLLLSGLLESDFDDIQTLCTQNHLKFLHKNHKKEWISILYQK